MKIYDVVMGIASKKNVLLLLRDSIEMRLVNMKLYGMILNMAL